MRGKKIFYLQFSRGQWYKYTDTITQFISVYSFTLQEDSEGLFFYLCISQIIFSLQPLLMEAFCQI